MCLKKRLLILCPARLNATIHYRENGAITAASTAHMQTSKHFISFLHFSILMRNSPTFYMKILFSYYEAGLFVCIMQEDAGEMYYMVYR